MIFEIRMEVEGIYAFRAVVQGLTADQLKEKIKSNEYKIHYDKQMILDTNGKIIGIMYDSIIGINHKEVEIK